MVTADQARTTLERAADRLETLAAATTRGRWAVTFARNYLGEVVWVELQLDRTVAATWALRPADEPNATWMVTLGPIVESPLTTLLREVAAAWTDDVVPPGGMAAFELARLVNRPSVPAGSRWRRNAGSGAR